MYDTYARALGQFFLESQVIVLQIASLTFGTVETIL